MEGLSSNGGFVVHGGGEYLFLGGSVYFGNCSKTALFPVVRMGHGLALRSKLTLYLSALNIHFQYEGEEGWFDVR